VLHGIIDKTYRWENKSKTHPTPRGKNASETSMKTVVVALINRQVLLSQNITITSYDHAAVRNSKKAENKYA